MTKIIQGGLFLVSAPFTLRIFLPESVFSKYRDEHLRSAGFPCSGGKAAGHGLPTTAVDTEAPRASLQAMVWCEAVEPIQAVQGATTVGLRQFKQSLGSQACTWGVAGFACNFGSYVQRMS